MNGKNDRETHGYTAVDYVWSVTPPGTSKPRSDLMTSTCRAITRTLNEHYQTQRYGLGGANTTYPISAFITDLVYLEGTGVHVDVKKITVRFLVY